MGGMIDLIVTGNSLDVAKVNALTTILPLVASTRNFKCGVYYWKCICLHVGPSLTSVLKYMGQNLLCCLQYYCILFTRYYVLLHIQYCSMYVLCTMYGPGRTRSSRLERGSLLCTYLLCACTSTTPPPLLAMHTTAAYH